MSTHTAALHHVSLRQIIMPDLKNVSTLDLLSECAMKC